MAKGAWITTQQAMQAALVGCCATLGSAAAGADTLVAVRPGAMCAAADVLARLTLPDGSDRAAGPGARPDWLALKQAGGCIDIPAGARVSVQVMRHNTSIVTFDANDGRGGRTFVVPNIDFRPDAGSPAAAAAPSSVAPAPTGSIASAAAIGPSLPAAGSPAPTRAEQPALAPASQPAAPFSLPPIRNYESVVLALLKQTPALAADDQVVRWWASYRFAQAWWQVRNQEFKLQPLLAQARADLDATLAATPAGIVTLDGDTQFGAYDFAKSRFPLSLGFNQVSVAPPCCGNPVGLPGSVSIMLAGLDGVDGLPMAPGPAEAFVDRRTRYRNVDRQLALLLTVKLDPAGLSRTAYGQWQARGTVQSVEVLSDRRNPELVYHVSAAELAALSRARAQQAEQAQQAADDQRRQAEQARQAELQASQAASAAQQAAFRRQQLLERRQQLVAALSQAPLSVRLASVAAPGDGVSAAPLDNLRAVRARALLLGEPVGVTMLVQAGAGGDAAPAAWPGHLAMLAPHGQTFVAGHWYLVTGRLGVPPGDDLPPARLAAEAVVACAGTACSDVAEPAVIVERKLAALGTP